MLDTARVLARLIFVTHVTLHVLLALLIGHSTLRIMGHAMGAGYVPASPGFHE